MSLIEFATQSFINSDKRIELPDILANINGSGLTWHLVDIYARNRKSNEDLTGCMSSMSWSELEKFSKEYDFQEGLLYANEFELETVKDLKIIEEVYETFTKLKERSELVLGFADQWIWFVHCKDSSRVMELRDKVKDFPELPS